MLTRRSCIGFGAILIAGGSVPFASAANGDSRDQDPVSRTNVWHDPEIPALGNPEGDLTVVEYFDYQCPICKSIHPELSNVIQKDGKVRLVPKSWPIFGDTSVYAARIALATKYQDKFAQTHEALFAAGMPLTRANIHEILSKADVDVKRAIRDLEANGKTITEVLARNELQATTFGFAGTPGFIIGTFRVNGGLDEAGFKQAISAAREAKINH
jgi:protein-disulfide isomerase